MNDFKKNGSEGWQRFARESRTHTSATRDVAEGSNHTPRYQKVERTHTQGVRRSFNPNFTADNRLRDGGERNGGYKQKTFKKSYEQRGGGYNRDYNRSSDYNADDRFNRVDYVPSEERSFNRSDRPYNAERGYNRYGDSSQERGERNYGNRKPYGSYAGKSSYSKPYRKPYGESNDNREGGFNRESNYNRDNNRRTSQTFSEKPRRSYPRYDAPKAEDEIRLNKYVAQSGLCSRREADEHILAGEVSVNGVVVTELGTKVKPTDEIKFNDKVLRCEKLVYIVMNKPKGFVTSIDDPHADKTVMDLVKNACTERIYPVGRLDKNSVGVLLLTNDGELTKRLTHPEYNHRKVYEVTLNKAITEAELTKIAEGITLEDGDIAADEVATLDNTRKLIGVEIHSGRNRIVRRIFEHFGYSVVKLDRVYFAGLTKKNLKRGQWRFLSDKEVRMLKTGMYE
ncbi:MAG: rRNA pseudouridine synthase [Rikenellaceae bacterium]|nr:rRNA pseudouridine synthase [Rikenellaceae bacterium]